MHESSAWHTASTEEVLTCLLSLAYFIHRAIQGVGHDSPSLTDEDMKTLKEIKMLVDLRTQLTPSRPPASQKPDSLLLCQLIGF